MPAPANLGFETAGAAPGGAASWQLRARATAGEAAGYALLACDPLPSPSAFDSGDWTPAGVFVTADAADAPDGSTTADLLAAAAGAGLHGVVSAAPAYALDADVPFTVGAYLKAGSARYAGVCARFGGSDAWALADLQTGAPAGASPVASPVGAVTVAVTDVGGGWVRVELTITPSAPTTATPAVVVSVDGLAIDFNAAPPLAALAWGAYVYRGALRDGERFAAGWGNDDYGDVIASSTGAAYDVGKAQLAQVDGFEGAWANTPYLSEIAGATAAVYGLAAVDGLEAGWGNDAFQDALAPGDVTQATYGGLGADGFEAGWNNSAYQDWMGPGDVTQADYNASHAEQSDTFEHVLLDKLYTVDPGTDLFTSQAHGLVAGDTVYVRNKGGTIPSGLNPSVLYYVLAAGLTADTFKLSTTAGGGAVDVTDAGSGLQHVTGDPARYWTSDGFNAAL